MYFEMGSGGRFLMNSLSLSDGCVFPNEKLARLQINGKLNKNEKLKFLNLSISNTKKEWNDLNLKDVDWTGVDYDIHFNLSLNEWRNFKYKKVFSNLTIKNEKYLFLNAHSIEELNTLRKIWKNSKVISFTNQTIFNGIRRHTTDHKKFIEIWKLLAKRSWPHAPYSKKHYLNMPEQIKQIVNNKLKDEDFLGEVIDNLISHEKNIPNSFSKFNKLPKSKKIELIEKYKNDEYNYSNSCFVWDTNWYLSLNDTLTNIKKLYDVLGLTDYDEDAIKLYYNLWKNKLDEIKK